MFGFEITSDLLIVAIFAQTIAISLIILTIYFKIKKIHYKNIDLHEKIDEKLDRVESKLSYLYNQVLVISANQDKFNYTKSSLIHRLITELVLPLLRNQILKVY